MVFRKKSKIFSHLDYLLCPHGKVAERKFRAMHLRYPRSLTMKEIKSLLKVIRLKTGLIKALKEPKDTSSAERVDEERRLAIRQLRTEEDENKDLLQRKNHLISNIDAQRKALETARMLVTSFEAQVQRCEQAFHSLRMEEERFKTESSKEISDLQMQLKVCTKLNNLQSAKIKQLEATM